MNIKVVIAAHKKYRMPEDEMYLPLHVGHHGKQGIGFAGDDTGDNISDKNANFCELTGIYWAWKNLDADAVGLVHYRRHFAEGRAKDKFDCVLTKSGAEKLLKSHDAILPKKQNYYIENLYSHYAHTHDAAHLELLGEILRARCPEYLPEYEMLKKRTSAHMFNMFIMKKDLFDRYCEWMFPILFEIEKKVDIAGYSAFEARLFGRISELMLDIWINTNKINYTEVPFIYMEKIDWSRKIKSFVGAKFFGKKYGKSF